MFDEEKQWDSGGVLLKHTHKKVGKKRRNLKREEPERGGVQVPRGMFSIVQGTHNEEEGGSKQLVGEKKKKKKTSLYIFTTPAFGKQENAPMFGTWESCPFNTIIYFLKKKNVFFLIFHSGIKYAPPHTNSRRTFFKLFHQSWRKGIWVSESSASFVCAPFFFSLSNSRIDMK